MENTPIIIVGMARSGTTLVSHILGSFDNVQSEVEPHALWKSGNFKYLNDEEYDINSTITKNIREKLTSKLGSKRLIEKSPINVLRPHLVHAVFPEAKIVYVEREPVRCIYSNFSRSLKKDSFKLSIIIKKYFRYTGSEDLSGAISERKLFQQISLKDVPDFIRYSIAMFRLRSKNLLPFGPKIKDFANIVKNNGLLYYHVEVYKKALNYKQVYQELYKDKIRFFKMEDIMKGGDNIKQLIEFCGFAYNEKWLKDIESTFDKERIKDSGKNREIDHEISALLMRK